MLAMCARRLAPRGAMKRAVIALAAVASVAACSSRGGDADTPDLTVTISGEGAAARGFAFPPASPGDLAFVDGWDVRFERVLVTVDAITLSDDPDANPTDQAATGRVLATARGPWAVDMTRPGVVERSSRSALLDGEGAYAQPLARFDALGDGASFDPTRRYAFGFDIVAATASANRTNLDAAADADYALMIEQGLSVLYVGAATFRGAECTSSDPSYDFSKLPTFVRFRFGFTTPTTYKNCQNTDLRGKPFDGEEAQRGVQVGAHGGTVAQITMHVDHPFWSTIRHDAAELFFDQMAAAASPDGTLTLDDLAKLDPTGFTDAEGRPLPWRSCLSHKPAKVGPRRFDAGNLAVDPTAAPGAALRSYADFVQYQQSNQGHLNADGLCAVERRFASPR